MAQWHVAEVTPTGLRVVIHFRVPTTKNAANSTLKDSAINTGRTCKDPSPWASAEELADLASGVVAEVEMLAGIDGAKPLLDQREAIQKQVTAYIAQVKEQWQKDLAFTGYSQGEVI